MKRLIYILLVLLLLPIAAGASNVVQVVRITDTSGSPVSGVSFTAGGVALTAGTSATTVPGVNLDTGAALTNQTLKYYDPNDGSGEYFFIFDPSSAEAHFLLVASKNGVSISNATVGLNFFGDPSTLAATNTRVTTALPAAAPGGTGGLPTTNSSNQVAVSNFPATVSLSSGDETHLANADTQSATAATQATAAASSSATAVTQTSSSAIGHDVLGASLDPLGSSPLTVANALWDMWCVGAGPTGVVTYSGSVQTTPYLRHDGTTASWSSALTTNSAAKPLVRTPTITSRPPTP